MRSSRPTLLRRIVGLASVAMAGLAAAGLIYSLRSDDDAPPAAVGPTAPATTTRPPIVTGGRPHPARPLPGVGGGEDGSPSLDDVLEDIELVNVAFNAPRTMHLNDPVVIQLLLSGGQTIEQLQEELTALGEQEGDEIRASDAMEAAAHRRRLRHRAGDARRRAVSSEAVTEWKWEVEADEDGDRLAAPDAVGADRPRRARTARPTRCGRSSGRSTSTSPSASGWRRS